MMMLSLNTLFVCSILFLKLVQGQEKCDAVIDLTLLVDSSGSINQENFIKTKEALIDLVGRLNIATKKAGVAIINYASNVSLNAQNSVFEYNKAELTKQIEVLQRYGTHTATGDALVLAKKYCEVRCRPLNQAIPRIFIIFTDGHSNEGQPPIPAAQAIRDSPIEGNIFAVGIGNIGADGQKELLGIAGDKENVLNIASYRDLIRATNTIALQMCEFPAFIVPEVKTQVQVGGNGTRYYKMHTLHKKAKSAFFEIELNDVEGQVTLFLKLK